MDLDEDLNIAHRHVHRASNTAVVTRVGGNPESQYAFRHISCPTLSMMSLTMLMVFDEDLKITHTD